MKQGWHPEDIKAAIRKRGITVTQLALSNGLSESVCRFALIKPIPAGERVISEFLGVSPHELWPDRYDAQNRRLIPRPDTKRGRPRRQSPKAAAG
jgi:Ner family transcriptional regulator